MRRSGRVPGRPSPTISAAIQGKSLRFDVFGPPSVFRIEEVAIPESQPRNPEPRCFREFLRQALRNNGNKKACRASMHMSR